MKVILARAVLRPLGAVLCLAFFSLAVPPTLQAGRMLTNGHSIHVRVPPGEEERDIINDRKGFTIFVPPGAEMLTVKFATTPGADLQLLMRFGTDVGPLDAQGRRADFRAFPDGNGVATLVVTPFPQPRGHPDTRLTPGTYFIGFQQNEIGVPYEGILEATVDGLVILPERIVEESKFLSDLDGWTRNDAPSEIPGTNRGSRDSILAFRTDGGNPGGFAWLRAFGFRGPTEYFVAPPKFLVDLLAFAEPRFVFDVARLSGESLAIFRVQIRVFGAEGVYVWTGDEPPDVNGGWQTFSASIEADEWFRELGLSPFSEVFSNPERIEVRAIYSRSGGAVGLDNFRLLAKGDVPARPVLPTITSFSGGMDGWGRNYPEERRIEASTVGDEGSLLLWNDPEGNPGGFLRLAESGGSNPDAFVAPDDFVGDLSGLATPRFEFDYRHRSAAGATRPVTIRLIGEEAVFEWTGAVPGDVWGHQMAPLTGTVWTLVSGSATFTETLADVIRVEVSTDQAVGSESNSVDNFALLTIDTPPLPQTLTANPPALDFPGVATGPNPAPQTIQVTASGGDLQWEATVSGIEAERITLSDTSGRTPSIVTVQWDTQGLPSGTHQAVVTFTAVGVNTDPSEVVLNSQLAPQPNPTPQISQVLNAASKEPLLSQGALGGVYGQDLIGNVSVTQPTFGGRTGDMLPTSANGIRVLIYDANMDSLIGPAPLLSLSNEKIEFQTPFEVWNLVRMNVVVDNNGARSEPAGVDLATASPGIFTTGDNQAVAFNADGSPNSPSSPASSNSLLMVYLTGQGVTAPEWKTGKAGSQFPLIFAPGNLSVTIGGVPAEIKFFGLAPGMVGVSQVNLCPSAGTPSGEQPIKVTVGGRASNEPTVSIQ